MPAFVKCSLAAVLSSGVPSKAVRKVVKKQNKTQRRQKINIEENVKMYFNDQRQKEFIRFVPFDRRYIWASLAFIRPYSGSALICLF